MRTRGSIQGAGASCWGVGSPSPFPLSPPAPFQVVHYLPGSIRCIDSIGEEVTFTEPRSNHNKDRRYEGQDALKIGGLGGVGEDDHTNDQARVGEDREEGERRRHHERGLEVAFAGSRRTPAPEPTDGDDQRDIDHNTDGHRLEEGNLDQGLDRVKEEDDDSGRIVVDNEREENQNTQDGQNLDQMVHKASPTLEYGRIPGVVVGVV